MYRLLLIYTLAITFLAISCNDPISIDGQLPGGEEIEIVYTDTFSIDTKTIQGEISSTYILGVNNSTYLLGQLDDTNLGRSTSDIYLELDLISIPDDFKVAALDSIVLTIAYDTLGFYGDTLSSFNVEVRQMSEQMDGDTIKSTQSWAVDPLVIGSKTTIPSGHDSITITSHTSGELVTLPPQLRIPMTQEFGQMILDADSTNFVNEDNLIEFINGLNISATTSTSAMLGLNLSDVANASGVNKLRIYYHAPVVVNNVEIDSAMVYDFAFRTRTASTFVHETMGYPIEQYLADEDFNGDDFAFYQGMSGVETEVSFPTISELKDKLINNAEFIYYSISDPSETNQINTPIDLAATTYYDEDGERTLTTDASFAISSGLYTTLLGGDPELIDEEKGIYKTTVNITNHLNTVFNSENLSATFILTALQRSERSSRTVIFGSGSEEHKPILKLTYTNI